MKLKEFGLWGFKLKLTESREFTLFNRCVCAHYERHFKEIETDGIYRVVVKLSELEIRANTTETSSSVLKFYKEFDFPRFDNLDENSKKRHLLDTLHQSLTQLCDQAGWPTDNFDRAYKQVIQENIENIYTIKKKSNGNRTLIAELICDHNTSAFDCFLRVKTKSGKEIFSKLLFSEQPDEFLFNERIGNIKWLSNEALVHLKKDKTVLETFEFDIHEYLKK